MGMRASAQHTNALRNMSAIGFFICTSRADRGALVQITLSVSKSCVAVSGS